jgi:hypothetical protein
VSVEVDLVRAAELVRESGMVSSGCAIAAVSCSARTPRLSVMSLLSIGRAAGSSASCDG